MLCLNCGKEIGRDKKFCPNCGKETVYANQEKIGNIIIKREKKMTGSLIPFDVYIDDEKVGSLSNGSTLDFSYPLDSYTIMFKTPGSSVKKEITLTEEKKKVTLTVVPKMGMLTAKAFVKDITYFS